MYFNKIGLIYSVVMLFFARRQLELNDGMDIHREFLGNKQKALRN